MRTGFTKSELELLEKYLLEIAKLKKEQKENKVTDAKLNTMINDLELSIYKLKKRVSGTSVIDMDDKNKDKDKDKSTNTLDFEQRLDKIKEDLLAMKNADELLKKLTSSSSSTEQ